MKKARVFLLALVILGLLCGCGAAVTQTKDLEREAEAARFAADGSAYIVTESGSCSLEDVSNGCITPDRKHIVTLTDSGEIFYSDAAMENTVKVCDNAASFTRVRNDGFFYTSENDVTYRVRLASIDKGTRGSAGRKCPQSASKPLRIHKVFSAAFSLPEEHFRSGRTASHRTALYFRGIFVLLDAGGLSPTKEKRAKSSEKAGCPTCVPWLIDACPLL